jgi:hypothetical protein
MSGKKNGERREMREPTNRGKQTKKKKGKEEEK